MEIKPLAANSTCPVVVIIWNNNKQVVSYSLSLSLFCSLSTGHPLSIQVRPAGKSPLTCCSNVRLLNKRIGQEEGSSSISSSCSRIGWNEKSSSSSSHSAAAAFAVGETHLLAQLPVNLSLRLGQIFSIDRTTSSRICELGFNSIQNRYCFIMWNKESQLEPLHKGARWRHSGSSKVRPNYTCNLRGGHLLASRAD